MSEKANYGPALKVREFRYLWLAGAQSSAGDQLARVALSLLVYSRTHSAAATATTYALSFLPAFVGSMLLAGLADRYPRRTVMVVCDLLRFVLLIAVAALPMPTLLLDLAIVAIVLVGSPFQAAEVAVLPQLLPDEHYSSGAGLRMATEQFCQLAGFAFGGALVALIGTRTTLALDAATFLLSAVLLQIGLHHRPAAVPAEEQAAAEPVRVRPAHTIGTNPLLRALLGLIWGAAAISVPEAIAAPYADRLGGGATLTGLIMAAGPAGSLIGYVLLPRLVPERQRRRTTALTAAACGLSMAFCPLAVGSASATLALLALSGAFSAYLIAAMPWFVQEVPNEMRGRVVGFGQGGLLIAQGALSMGAGVLAGAASPQAATATAGIALAVVALLLHRPVAAAVEPEPITAVVPAVHPEASPS